MANPGETEEEIILVLPSGNEAHGGGTGSHALRAAAGIALARHPINVQLVRTGAFTEPAHIPGDFDVVDSRLQRSREEKIEVALGKFGVVVAVDFVPIRVEKRPDSVHFAGGVNHDVRFRAQEQFEQVRIAPRRDYPVRRDVGGDIGGLRVSWFLGGFRRLIRLCLGFQPVRPVAPFPSSSVAPITAK